MAVTLQICVPLIPGGLLGCFTPRKHKTVVKRTQTLEPDAQLWHFLAM